MFGAILDSIPGVGHAKGAFHYVTGDRIAAKRSMYEATRSTAVIAGGAAGALGGPAGMVAGAAAAGALTDTVTSVVTCKPQGVILGVSDIASDISNGQVPLGSVARTALIVGSDVVGGMAGPTIGNCATRVISESGGKAVGKVIVKQLVQSEVSLVTRAAVAHGTSRVLVEKCEERSKYEKSWKSSSSSGGSGSQSSSTNREADTSKKSESSKSSSTGGSSGSQPPNNNQNNNNKKEHNEKNEKKSETHKEVFLKIFKVKSLNEIIINGKKIFKDMNYWQDKELMDFIKDRKNYDYLDFARIVKITEELLSEVGDEYVTSHNFVNIAKFVLAYVHEQLTQRNDAYNQAPSNYPDLSTDYNTRRRQLAEIITSQNTNSIKAIRNFFKELMRNITELMQTIEPQFVNVIAAVYHYFKHKYISIKNIIYTPFEYFNLARENLKRLKGLAQYKALKEAGKKRIVYQRYFADVGRRLTIVIKLQFGKWNLSSCFFDADDRLEDDKDGDEWINDEKLPRKP